MGKRKLIEFLNETPHALHSFSTGIFAVKTAEMFPQIGANQRLNASFHKRQADVLVEKAWKT